MRLDKIIDQQWVNQNLAKIDLRSLKLLPYFREWVKKTVLTSVTFSREHFFSKSKSFV